jgi:MoaA/NifB/PqqE/SkfB family radical SAM enzyme
MEIFGTEIELKEFYCQRDDCELCKIENPYINIYVNLTNACNAKCHFCCNEKNRTNIAPFNYDKFVDVINEISSKLKIRKLSFTGGEPTLPFDILEDCIRFVKEKDPEIFVTVNTNGTNLKKLGQLHEYIDSIALSRHHYDDKKNAKIFQIENVPDTNSIKNFQYKEILHLSCNLMKSYIGSAEEVIKYLDYAASVECFDVGFVSLMPVNEYCQEEFVDFNSVEFDKQKDVFTTKNWRLEDKCRCRNYIYITENADIVNVYARYYVNSNYNSGTLVFDGQNLRKGFNGDIIC